MNAIYLAFITLIEIFNLNKINFLTDSRHKDLIENSKIFLYLNHFPGNFK